VGCRLHTQSSENISNERSRLHSSTPSSRVLLEKLTGSQLVKNPPHIMELEGSLPHSQEPVTIPYPELHQSTPCPHISLTGDLNIILPSTPGPSRSSLSLRFPHQNPLYTSTLPHSRYMPRPSNSYRFNNLASLRSYLHSLVTSSLLGSYTLLNTLSSNTNNLRSSLNVSDHISQPYKTGKITVLYTLNFKFGIANWKTKDSTPNDSKHSLTSICS